MVGLTKFVRNVFWTHQIELLQVSMITDQSQNNDSCIKQTTDQGKAKSINNCLFIPITGFEILLCFTYVFFNVNVIFYQYGVGWLCKLQKRVHSTSSRK